MGCELSREERCTKREECCTGREERCTEREEKTNLNCWEENAVLEGRRTFVVERDDRALQESKQAGNGPV